MAGSTYHKFIVEIHTPDELNGQPIDRKVARTTLEGLLEVGKAATLKLSKDGKMQKILKYSQILIP